MKTNNEKAKVVVIKTSSILEFIILFFGISLMLPNVIAMVARINYALQNGVGIKFRYFIATKSDVVVLAVIIAAIILLSAGKIYALTLKISRKLFPGIYK